MYLIFVRLKSYRFFNGDQSLQYSYLKYIIFKNEVLVFFFGTGWWSTSLGALFCHFDYKGTIKVPFKYKY